MHPSNENSPSYVTESQAASPMLAPAASRPIESPSNSEEVPQKAKRDSQLPTKKKRPLTSDDEEENQIDSSSKR